MSRRCQITSIRAVLLGAALVVLPLRAAAQQVPEAPDAGTPAPDAAPDAAAQPTTEPSPEVVRRMRQGIAFAEAGNCNSAIAEFEAAYAITPSPDPLYNIAMCRERLFQYDLAVSAYQRYLDTAPADAEDRPAVEATMRSLRNVLGTLHVRSNTRARVWIDDRDVGEAPGDLLVPGGRHVVELRAERWLPSRQEVTVAGRQEASLSFTLRRAVTNVTINEEGGISPVVFWSGVAATGVTALVGGIFGIRALVLHGDAQDLDPRLPRDAEIHRVEQTALVADVLYAAAGALAIGTTVVFFFTKWGDGERRPAQRAPATRTEALLAPWLGPDGAGLAIGGAL